VTVRSERPTDTGPIDAVIRAAFTSAGMGDGEPETRLVSAVRAAAGFDPRLSLVAEVAGGVVGHLLLSPCQIVTAGGNLAALALAPLSVVSGLESHHVGTRLMRAGLVAARCTDAVAVVVLGHPRYYARFGFRPAAEFGIEAPWPVDPRAFRVLRLRDGSLAGVVRYPSAFDAVAS
jgi:predicted N-acetyltransferase YhbS